MSYYVIAGQLTVPQWQGVLSKILPQATTLRLQFGSVQAGKTEQPGHTAFMAEELRNRADVTWVQQGADSAVATVQLDSDSGRQVQQQLQGSPPGQGQALFAYDILAGDTVLLAVRDVSLAFINSTLDLGADLPSANIVDSVDQLAS